MGRPLVVAFASDATNLVAGDTNGAADVFVRDLKTSKTRRVSLGSNGAQGHGSSGPSVAIAANGRYVAFDSAAANLVRGDTNKAADLFVRDLKTNATQRVSLNSKGAQANRASDSPAVSASGRFVAFHSQASNLGGGGSSPGGEIFVRDRKKKKTRIVSVSNAGVRANQDSTGAPAISSDGRFVAFFSAAELVGADTNGVEDVFVRDLKTNKTSRVSANSAGTIGNGSSQAPSISGDAVLVAFESTATNFVSGDTNDAFDIFTRGPLR